jgi:dihydropyrimidine dehydrogenase (NAD+) subunit PreA
MVESKRETWHEMVKRTEETGADGIELNFGCPHGMSERGMGSAVGQVPDYTCQIVEWVKEVAKIPVIVKLTPNVTDITYIARAAVKGGADALSLINTINSIVGVDLDSFAPYPTVAGKSSHGGYCGPAVKPIALHLVSAVAGDPVSGGSPRGVTRRSSWRWAQARCRCAPRRCITDSGSSRISATASRPGWTRRVTGRWTPCAARRSRTS